MKNKTCFSQKRAHLKISVGQTQMTPFINHTNAKLGKKAKKIEMPTLRCNSSKVHNLSDSNEEESAATVAIRVHQQLIGKDIN